MPTVTIRKLEESDEQDWLALWRGYNEFYERVIAEEITQITWSRLVDPRDPVYGHVAETGSGVVGLVHIIFHRSTSLIEPTCYLQDLFTTPKARGMGVGQRLIEAVYDEARARGSAKVYWFTHETNARAMSVYEKVALRSGFIQYRKDL
jgi:GNAT superfamily N-acetyltransferase